MIMRRRYLVALLFAVALVVFVGSAKAWHNDIVECYFYVLEQCGPDDQDCLDFGFDDCDGSYSTSVVGLTSKEAKLRTGKTQALTASQSRSAARLQRALRARQARASRTAPPAVYEWAKSVSGKLPREDAVRRLETATRQQAQAKRLVQEGQKLIQEVVATRGNLSDREADAFQRRMATIVGGLDRLVWNEPSEGGIADCMKGCDAAYPGTGGGKGWNRFVCKAACLVHGGDKG